MQNDNPGLRRIAASLGKDFDKSQEMASELTALSERWCEEKKINPEAFLAVMAAQIGVGLGMGFREEGGEHDKARIDLARALMLVDSMIRAAAFDVFENGMPEETMQ